MKSLIITVAAVLIMPLLAWADEVQAPVSNVTGSVEYALPGSSDFKPLTENTKLPEGVTLRTGSDSAATFSPFPGASCTLAPQSTLSLTNMEVDSKGGQVTERKAELNLSSGSLATSINRAAAGHSPVDYKIKTAACVAAARGTKYITVVVNGKTYIKVTEGKVALISPSGEILGYVTPKGDNVAGYGVVGPDGKLSELDPKDLPKDVSDAFNGAEQYVPGSTVDVPVNPPKSDRNNPNDIVSPFSPDNKEKGGHGPPV